MRECYIWMSDLPRNRGCGRYCTSCNLRTGCQNCIPEEQGEIGWVTAPLNEESSISSVPATYQDFKFCQECSNSKMCKSCSRHNSSECIDCVQEYNPPQTEFTCQHIDQVAGLALEGCYQLDYNTWQTYQRLSCLVCIDGYYIVQTDVLRASQVPINKCQKTYSSCKDAASSTFCNYCDDGYAEHYYYLSGNKYQFCESCNTSLFDNQRTNCELLNQGKQSAIGSGETLACWDGYTDSQTQGKDCVGSCPLTHFGQTSFNVRGLAEESKCQKCHSSCFECAGPQLDQCLSCSGSHFLNHQLLQDGTYASHGNCEFKSDDLPLQTEVWVSTFKNLNPIQSITGEKDNMFDNLYDALTRAYELGAPYNNASIKIIFTSTTHAMLRTNYGYYLPKYSDKNSQTTLLEITTQGEIKVKVNFKIGDKFRFKVGRFLILRNIIFDAVDSIISNDADSGECLSQIENCCKIQGSILSGHKSCNFTKQPSEHCFAAVGSTFIEFDISATTMLKEPAQLIIDRVEFRNFYYDYNSFIQLNEFGSRVKIQNSVFSQHSTCGSIVRTKQPYVWSNYELPQVDQPTIYNYKVNNYYSQLIREQQAAGIGIPLYNPLNCSTETTDILHNCFIVDIYATKFEDFNLVKVPQKYPTYVNINYDMQYYGTILDIYNFTGHINLKQNNFTNIILAYDTCDVSEDMDLSNVTQPEMYLNYGINKNLLQIRSVISVVKHIGDLVMIDNKFEECSGTKGVVYLDMYDRTNKYFLIEENQFLNNAGYLDNSVIFLRARGPKNLDVYQSRIETGIRFCFGYHIDHNSFSLNRGCSLKSGGLLRFECVNQSQSYSSGNDRYTLFSPLLLNDIQNQDNSNNQNTDSSSNTLIGNYISQNFGTGGKGLIDFQNIPNILIKQNNFVENGESALETQTKSPIKPSYFELNITHILGNMPNYLKNSHLLTKSLINIEQAQHLRISDNQFDMNWQLETTYSLKRSQLITIENCDGINLELGSIQVSNQKGIQNKITENLIPTIKQLLAGTRLGLGSMFPLIRFVDTTSLSYGSLIFKDSLFYKVEFIQQAGNKAYPFIIQTNNIFNFTYANIVNSYFQNIICYECHFPLFDLRAKQVQIKDTIFQFINTWPLILENADFPSFFKVNMISSFDDTAQSSYLVDNITIFNYQNGHNHTFFQFIQTEESQQDFFTVKLQNSVFINNPNFVQKNGSLFELEGENTSLGIYHSTFSQLKGHKSIFNVRKSSIVSIYNVTAIDFGDSQFLNYKSDKDIIADIQQSNIQCLYLFNRTIIEQDLMEGRFSDSSVFQFEAQNVSLESKNNHYSNCFTKYEGGVIKLLGQNNKFSAQNDQYVQNAALNGGDIYCANNCKNIRITNCKFKYNIAYHGSTFQFSNWFMEGNDDLIVENNTFTKNYGIDGICGLFYFNENPIGIESSKYQLLYQFNQIDGNYQTFQHSQSNLAKIISVQTQQNISFTSASNIFKESNSLGDQRIIFSIESLIKIKKVNIDIFIIETVVTSYSEQFENLPSILYINEKSYYGDLAYGSSDITLNITTSNFLYNGYDAFAIYVSGNVNANIDQTLIKSSKIDNSRGLVFANKKYTQQDQMKAINQIQITQSTLQIAQIVSYGFFQCQLTSIDMSYGDQGSTKSFVQGGIADIKSQKIQIYIRNLIGQSIAPYHKGGLFSFDIEKQFSDESTSLDVKMIDIKVYGVNENQNYTDQGGLLYIQSNGIYDNDVYSINIERLRTFTQNSIIQYPIKANYGGGIYIESYDQKKYQILITDSLINSVATQNGGFIYADQIQDIDITMKNCVIRSHAQNDSGGVIYVCPEGQANINLENLVLDDISAEIGALVYTGCNVSNINQNGIIFSQETSVCNSIDYYDANQATLTYTKNSESQKKKRDIKLKVKKQDKTLQNDKDARQLIQ